MAFRIRPDHPLYLLFNDLVRRNFMENVRLDDSRLTQYVAALLVDFTHVDNLYRIRNTRGKRLEDVGEMLIESNPLLDGRSFIYERQVRKHIGDYTLFLTGLFPEHVSTLRKQQGRLESLIDFMNAGRESYRIVAAFDDFEFRDEAPLFRGLSDRFELCVFGLNLVKQDLERINHGWYRQARDTLVLD